MRLAWTCFKIHFMVFAVLCAIPQVPIAMLIFYVVTVGIRCWEKFGKNDALLQLNAR
jgi:hypothetical protein